MGAGAVTGRARRPGAAFLAPARAAAANGIAPNPVHPPPPPRRAGRPVPLPRYRNLDPTTWSATFAAAVAHAEGVCHVVDGDVPDACSTVVVASWRPAAAVVVREPEARGRRPTRGPWASTVGDATVDAAAAAGLGVTGAVAAIAATGSVVLDSRVAGGRTASLLPDVHLCVVTVNILRATRPTCCGPRVRGRCAAALVGARHRPQPDR